MDFDQLESFISVAKLKNFSKAAVELNVTQPTVSSRIIKLEQELGTLLFHRTKQSLSLTPEGELFLSYSKRVTNQMEEAKRIINVTKKPLIKIGIPPNISPHIFPNVFKKIDLKKVNILLEDRVISNTLIEKIQSEQLTLALTSIRNGNSNLHFEKIIDDPLVFVIGKNHHLAKYDRITSDLLNNETIIRLESKNLILSPAVENVLDQIELNFIESNQEEMQKELVSKGHGFAIFPIHYINANDLQSYKIIPFTEINQLQKEIYFVCKKEALRDKYVALILSELKLVFKKRMSVLADLNLIPESASVKAIS